MQEEPWNELARVGNAYLISEHLLMSNHNWPIQITAGARMDKLSRAEFRYCKVEEAVLYPWLSGPNEVEIETPLAKFWASSAKGKARPYFDDEGCPLVGVSVFFAIESGDRTERYRALRLLRKENPNFVGMHDGELSKFESDVAFNGCVKEWLFARAKANRLSETDTEMKIAKKRFEDTSRPRSRTWTSSNQDEAAKGYTIPERIFFEALNHAILKAKGVPFLSEVRSEYERIALLHKEKHLAEERERRQKANQEISTLKKLQTQKTIPEPSVRSFDKVFREMGFDWLPKEQQMRELGQDLRFYRLNMEV